MSKIYDFTPSYDISKRYVTSTFRKFYSKFIVIGEENIPHASPVIFAPNHNNALMDALAILATIPHEDSIVFLARADMFNNKMAARLLTFTKIMPAFRMRDGVENLGKNQEIFERCIEVLDNNKALGIMPEGNQGEQKKLRPLVKGIFRIAFATQLKYGTTPTVKIVPVGLDYGDYIKYGKHIIVNYGKPIEVAEYMEQYSDNPVLATNAIRNRLKEDLSNLMLNIDSTDFYDCFEAVIEIANRPLLEQKNTPTDEYSLFVGRQDISTQLSKIEKENPAVIQKLDTLTKEYRDGLFKLKLKTGVLEKAPFKLPELLRECLLLVIGSPVFVLGFIFNVLPFFTPVLLRKYVFKAKYLGFFSSLHYGLGIVTFPLFYLIQMLLFANLISSLWWACLLFIIGQFLLGKWALLWYRKFRKFIAKLRYNKLKNTFLLNQVQEIRQKIIKIFTANAL